MQGSTKLFDLIKDLLEQLPSLLTLLVCIVIAIMRWKKNSTVALVVLISLAFLLVHLLVFAIVYNWVPDMFIQASPGLDRAIVIRNVYIIIGLITNTSLAIGLVALLIGVFMQRPRRIEA
jgi:hypothetical protein